MRTLWNGTLSFGLVTIPVGLASTRSKREPTFRVLHRPDRQPVKQVMVCPEHGQVDDVDELVRAWEVAKGQLVPLEPEELEALKPDETRGIELVAIVPVDAIDELYVESSYWLVPSESPIGRRAYRLLAGALTDVDGGALCKMVVWRREHNCLVKPAGGALLLQMLASSEDMCDPDELVQSLEGFAAGEDERELARELAVKLQVPFEPAMLTNAHRDRVRALLESKLAGEPIIQAEAKTEPPAPQTTDLAAALRKSVRTARKPKRPRARASA